VISSEEDAARLEDAADLPEGGAEVGEVSRDERVRDEVERPVPEREP